MMKNPISQIIILSLLSLFCSRLSAQTDPVIYSRHLYSNTTNRYADVQADVDLYHSLIKDSVFVKLQQRRRELQQTTPLEKLVGDYVLHGFDVLHDTISLFTLFNELTIYTHQEQLSILDKVKAIGQRVKSKDLDLFIGHMSANLMDNKTQYAEKMECFERVVRQAKKYRNNRWVAFTMREIWGRSYYGERYAESFVNLPRLIEALDRVDDGYPLKGLEYVWPGIANYRFWNFDQALFYFNKALSYRQFRDGYLGGNYMRAWSYMAAYHHERGNLDSAAYYNRTILTSSDAKFQFQSNIDFAICNLGRVEMQRGNYDGAIKLLEAGLEYIEKDDSSYEFMCGVYISLGECYLAKGDLRTATYYIDKARNSIPQNRERNKFNRLRGLYALQSNYYTRIGDSNMATAYLDSAIVATSRFGKITGQHVILLGEQQLQEAEIKVKKQQIARQKAFIFSTIIVLLLVSVAIVIILHLYRRRNAAYMKLAEKAQQWALVDQLVAVESGSKCNEPPTKEDLHIMRMAGHEMTGNFAYREAGLTVESLAERLGVHRNALSRAISHTTDGNFNHYLNGYRIKEAVRIISESSRKELYIQELYERVGFSNRSTFNRVFKQFTGLTPLEFQKQNENNFSSEYPKDRKTSVKQ